MSLSSPITFYLEASLNPISALSYDGVRLRKLPGIVNS